ncbi:hypothetical protein [Stutzerimonas stutzeri]|uniref:hypothetical protein n=1 Tax=Stutzerimonas stutzeri TaxID=316 RepID=UPI0002F06ABC|nr:hypothetical protein [Stutzerimonas stutzeri]
MDESRSSSLHFLTAAEERAETELKFTTECKNTAKLYAYDLSSKPYSDSFRDVLGVVVWAIYRRRNMMGHLSRLAIIEILPRFFKFLESVLIYRAEQLSGDTLRYFAEWLKKDKSLSYSTAASMYRKISPVFLQMSSHYKVSDSFIPVRNAFPKSSSLVSSCVGYDQEELKGILNAAVRGMRESASRFEKTYQPKWIGIAPPLEDVAPIGPCGSRSYWASEEYRTWWWENNCGCMRLNSNALYKLPKGQAFFQSTAPDGKKGSVKYLSEFYDRIGAGPDYKPKYLGLPCPINYRTPWKKKDYLVWYWENKLGCRALSGGELKKIAPEFWGALKEYFGGRIKDFYKELGVYRWVQAEDLIPYYLLLLIRTQLNPSTVQRLTIDCLVPDPLNDGRVMIDWKKYRSFKKGMTIPTDKGNDGWPAMIIKRVSAITESIREDGQDELWIANANRFKVSQPLGSSAFKRALQAFSRKHALTSSDGKPLSIQARLIRPAMAWSEYLRTEDMNYLQALLGHARLSTTADYLRRLDDPIFLTRRAVHQDAVFVRLSSAEDGSLISESLEASESTQGMHEALLNHCRDPLRSPASGQKTGSLCSASSEVCLGCQNLIITFLDIKKYFCFIAFHDYLLQAGDITDLEHRKATSEKRFIWENYILVKYDSGVIERIRSEALTFPILEWDISLYEERKHG